MPPLPASSSINEFFGLVGDGVGFEEDTNVFAERRHGLLSVPASAAGSFPEDIAQMLKTHQTYGEAVDAAFVMPAQRLAMVGRMGSA